MNLDHLMPVDSAVSTASKESAAAMSRRVFLKSSVTAGGGLLLGVSLPMLPALAAGSGPKAGAEAGTEAGANGHDFEPNAFIRLDPNGIVTLIIPNVEMGQGTFTSMPMLIAEDMEVDLSAVRVENAPADDKRYANPLLGFQVTGGSTSVRGAWVQLRKAGATARVLLVSAAAQRWGVPAGECEAAHGVVTHKASNRRLGYGELAGAAARLPIPADAPLKDPKQFRLIGTSPARLETPTKVNGTAKYGIDALPAGVKFAAVAACPVIGGKLGSVDDSKAKAVKGVRQIVRLDNAVAVIADHTGAARKGLAALVIKWDDGANAKVSTASMVAALDAASRQPGVVAVSTGDSAKAMRDAARRVEAVYQQPFLAHAPMEPMNCTVRLGPDGCDLWVGTQVATRAQAAAAQASGLALEKVRVHNHLLGGGFGRRLDVEFVTQAVLIAKQAGVPVKLIWSREEDIQHSVVRPYYYDRMAAGLGRDGKPTVFTHRVTGSSILARWAPPAFKNGLDSDAVEAAAGPYAFDNVLVDYVRHEPPAGITTGWWRGVGVTHNAFMVEGFVDELAASAGKDPVAYRRALLDKDPRARAVLDLAAAKAGWGTPLAKGRARGVALTFGFGSYVAQVVELSVAGDGSVSVHRIVCAVDCGINIDPENTRAQMEGGAIFGLSAALFNEVTFKDGRVEQSNFHNYRVLRLNEMPTIDVHIVESQASPGGIGEVGTTVIGPAVVNAIFAATGKRLRKLPVDTAALAAPAPAAKGGKRKTT